ncbi:hypothetical protein [Massilia sp. TS11]|uniref:T6SS immunity protein Tli3 family protein n=1 Tax=Massilia sp. TS11 TaxID=2908003 RepID=UPI001EDA3E59|nr:hypothetical protein [Massilia sp. TS11]MCG2582748.1 hypothetical protein [Massilia sp. TS11]
MNAMRASFVLAMTLCGCGYRYVEEPYTVPPPQVVYRIDEARHFEVVPLYRYSCTRAQFVYVDASRGIRSVVTHWDNVIDSEYIVDAASGPYLVSPLISPNCESGGGHVCDERFYYSDDYGKSWHKGTPKYVRGHDSVSVVGDDVYYSGQRAKVADLGKGYDAWDADFLAKGNEVPRPKKPPMDTRFHCKKSGGE